MPKPVSAAKVGLGQKAGYGLGAIAYALPYQIMASFFLFFVTSICCSAG
jgi:Na+/melibiose symporter-like transporter